MADIVSYSMIPSPGGGTVSPPGIDASPVHYQEWYDPDDGTRVGLRETRQVFDAAGLLARARDIHARHPITDPATGDPYTDEALEAAVNDWISAAGA